MEKWQEQSKSNIDIKLVAIFLWPFVHCCVLLIFILRKRFRFLFDGQAMKINRKLISRLLWKFMSLPGVDINFTFNLISMHRHRLQLICEMAEQTLMQRKTIFILVK